MVADSIGPAPASRLTSPYNPSMEKTHDGVVLHWQSGQRFTGEAAGVSLLLDGASDDAISPMQALMAGLAGCMAIDVVHILEKGRLPLEQLDATLTAQRAEGPPRRFTAYRLHFRVVGDVKESRVQRAIDLSKDTYCSVWHSLRQDVDFDIDFEIIAPTAGS